MKYISADNLIAEVKNKNSSYFEQGAVDESILYPVLISAIASLGLKVLPEKSVVLTVTNNKAKLPSDFHKAKCLYGCNMTCIKANIDDGLTNWVERDVCEIPICKTTADYCTDTCGQVYEIVQQFSQYKATFHNFFQVSVVGTSTDWCDLNKTNPRSPTQVTMSNGYLHTNFLGSIYMEYCATLVNEADGTIMVPDHPKITDWIKDKLTTEIMEKMFLNGNNDVYQRLMYQQQRLTISQLTKESFIRTTDVNELVAMSKALKLTGMGKVQRRIK